MSLYDIFGDTELEAIESAIASAEKSTSGEIRVHLDEVCEEDVLDHAAFIFEELEMHKTEQRNGVLFYVSVNDHKFAILGDGGINAKVPANFWEEIKATVLASFKLGEYVAGLEKGIQLAGEQLGQHFPFKVSDKNELSNEVSMGDLRKGGKQ